MDKHIDGRGPHPEATAHWATVSNRYEDIHEFMQFLNSMGIELDYANAASNTPMSIKVLINNYLGVNRAQLEEQRQWLLAQQRKANERTAG